LAGLAFILKDKNLSVGGDSDHRGRWRLTKTKRENY